MQARSFPNAAQAPPTAVSIAPGSLALIEAPARITKRLRRATRAVGPRRASAISLAQRWAAYARDPQTELRNHLVEHYQPLMRELVRRFAQRLPRVVDRGDLDTAASFGLIAAIEAFEPERGVRFESYCELRVRGALLDELRNQDWLPRPWRARLELHKRAIESLRSVLSREPNESEIATALGLSPEDYRTRFSLGLQFTLDPQGALAGAAGGAAVDGDDALPGLEIVPDPHSGEDGERIGIEELFDLAAAELNPKEYLLVHLKYREDLSLREIGALLELSESRVCKIHTRLLERLKDRLRSSGAA